MTARSGLASTIARSPAAPAASSSRTEPERGQTDVSTDARPLAGSRACPRWPGCGVVGVRSARPSAATVCAALSLLSGSVHAGVPHWERLPAARGSCIRNRCSRDSTAVSWRRSAVKCPTSLGLATWMRREWSVRAVRCHLRECASGECTRAVAACLRLNAYDPSDLKATQTDRSRYLRASASESA